MDDLELRLLIRAELAGTQAQLAALERRLDGLGTGGSKTAAGLRQAGDAAATAGTQASAAAPRVSGLSTAFGTLQRAVAAYLSYRLAGDFITAADSARILESRVENLTAKSGDFEAVWSRIYDVSQANGVAVSDTVKLFQRLQVSAERLGANNTDVLDVVRAVQQLGRESGATADEMRNASVQFGQMLSSPLAQAEELNSILDAMPALARAIEKGLGLLPGGLKAAAAAGLDTSRIFETLKAQSAEINARAGNLAGSIGQGWERIGNAGTRLVATIDQSVSGTERLSGLLSDMAGILDQIRVGYANAFNTEGTGINAALTGEDRFNALVERRRELLKEVEAQTKNVAAAASATSSLTPWNQGALESARSELVRMQTELAAVTTEIVRIQDANRKAAEGAGDLRTAGEGAGSAIGKGASEAKDKLDSLRGSIKSLEQSLRDMDAVVSGGTLNDKKPLGFSETVRRSLKTLEDAGRALAQGNLKEAVDLTEKGAQAITDYVQQGGAADSTIGSLALRFKEMGEAASNAGKLAKTADELLRKTQENVIDIKVRPVLDDESYQALLAQITGASQTIKVGVVTEIIGSGGFSNISVDAKGNPVITGSSEIQWESDKKGATDAGTAAE